MFNSSNSENLIALGPDEGLQCTTSSTNLNFSDCHSEEIVENKAYFIANFLVVILFGGSANLITMLALPYVRLRWDKNIDGAKKTLTQKLEGKNIAHS